MKASTLLTFFITLWMLVTTGRADTWQKAEIYFIDWDTTTRTALSPEQVRAQAKSKDTIGSDKAPKMAEFLKIHQQEPTSKRSQAAEVGAPALTSRSRIP